MVSASAIKLTSCVIVFRKIELTVGVSQGAISGSVPANEMLVYVALCSDVDNRVLTSAFWVEGRCSRGSTIARGLPIARPSWCSVHWRTDCSIQGGLE